MGHRRIAWIALAWVTPLVGWTAAATTPDRPESSTWFAPAGSSMACLGLGAIRKHLGSEVAEVAVRDLPSFATQVAALAGATAPSDLHRICIVTAWTGRTPRNLVVVEGEFHRTGEEFGSVLAARPELDLDVGKVQGHVVATGETLRGEPFAAALPLGRLLLAGDPRLVRAAVTAFRPGSGIEDDAFSSTTVRIPLAFRTAAGVPAGLSQARMRVEVSGDGVSMTLVQQMNTRRDAERASRLAALELYRAAGRQIPPAFREAFDRLVRSATVSVDGRTVRTQVRLSLEDARLLFGARKGGSQTVL